MLAATTMVAAYACAAAPDPGLTGTTTEGHGGSAATGTGGDIGLGGAFVSSASTGAGGVNGVGCSSDLQSVVDGNGAVIQQCPPDQGCSEGACVPACEAAAKSHGSLGCTFYAPDPPFLSNGVFAPNLNGPCYAVFLANAWGRPAKIVVSRGGQSFDVTSFGRIPKGVGPSTTYAPIPATGLPPDEVAVLFLSHNPGVNNFSSLECPVPPAVLADAAVEGSGKGHAFKVESDTPVQAYDILPYGGSHTFLPSATLLFPASAWGTNYEALTPHGSNGSRWAAVVAAEDATTLTIAPATTLPGGGGIADAPQGQATQYTLNAGEILQWLDPNLNAAADPSGAVIQSDKPIGLWTGNTYLSAGSQTSPGGGAQDSAHQQIPHVKALGSEYVGAGVVTRLPSLAPESVPYRLMGVVDGTTLTWDPAPPGAPTTLAAGQVVELETTQVFSVKSQDADHPFVFTQYLPGCPGNTRPGCSGPPLFEGQMCGLGDEEWVNLLPPQQYLRKYVFFTDPTYGTTNLVIVRARGANGFADVSIACLGAVTGWMPVGTKGDYEYAHVDLVRGGTPLANCNTSRHVADSKGAFGITVWGTDWYSSYGYPAGGNLGTINEVVVTPIPK
ncbi:MAG: IgGFc-binding protein [Minicystis sp.]